MDKVAFYKEEIYKLAITVDEIVARNKANRPRKYTVKPNGRVVLDGFADGLPKARKGIRGRHIVVPLGIAALAGGAAVASDQHRKNMRKRLHERRMSKSASIFGLGKPKEKKKSKAMMEYERLVAQDEAIARTQSIKDQNSQLRTSLDALEKERAQARQTIEDLTKQVADAGETIRDLKAGPKALTVRPSASGSAASAAADFAKRVPKTALKKYGPLALGGLGLAGIGAGAGYLAGRGQKK